MRGPPWKVRLSRYQVGQCVASMVISYVASHHAQTFTPSRSCSLLDPDCRRLRRFIVADLPDADAGAGAGCQ